LLGDTIQRRVNSIAGDRDDSNSSLVRREFGRRLARRGTCPMYAHGRIYTHRAHSRELLSLGANMTLSYGISADDVCGQGDDAGTFINYIVPATFGRLHAGLAV